MKTEMLCSVHCIVLYVLVQYCNYTSVIISSEHSLSSRYHTVMGSCIANGVPFQIQVWCQCSVKS